MMLEALRQSDLDRVNDPDVEAVFFRDAAPQDAREELANAIETGAFRIPRTIMPWLSDVQIAEWLAINIPGDSIPAVIRSGLIESIMGLVDRTRDLSGASHFMVRVFTGSPNCRCGFHLDTVPPRAPTAGLLYVANGAPTLYVDSENVKSMTDFYTYLGKRERLVRRIERADNRNEVAVGAELTEQLEDLDRTLPFLSDPRAIKSVPSCSVIAFKQVDARLHWSDHSPTLAWIHSSPSEGLPRLVINIAGKEVRRPAKPNRGLCTQSRL